MNSKYRNLAILFGICAVVLIAGHMLDIPSVADAAVYSAMAGPVTDAHRVTYRENVKLALQEKKDQFGDRFSYIDNVNGKEMRVTDIVGKIEARIDAAEGGDTPDLEGTHEPVWVRPRRIDWGKLIKKEDQIKALTDYKSEYVQAGVNGIIRAKNGLLASALFGPRLIGNEVPVSTPWNGKTVAVDYGSTGTPNRMSVDKILKALENFQQDDVEVDEEMISIAMNPQQNRELYEDITFTSKDYRDKSVMENKQVREILGMPIFITKRIADYDGSTATAAIFCQSGMHWGPAMPIDIKSAPNPAKQFREHAYIEHWIAVTRSEDALAQKILSKK